MKMFILASLCIFVFEICGVYGIETYKMEDICGQHLNLKWKGIHTAEIRLNPKDEPQVTNTSNYGPASPRIPYTVVSGVAVCNVIIESWDFQDRLMFYFKGVQFKTTCSDVRLEILDGTALKSPPVSGIERPICNQRRPRFAGKTFMTTDKYLTLRLSGNPESMSNVSFALVVVSFNDGGCRSYEHQCASGICIMEELVCNGHNPCGDMSDCPVTPTEAAEEESHVIKAAIITASIFCVGMVIGTVVFCRCYHKRVKLRRQRLHQHPHEHTQLAIRIENGGVERNDSDIQNETTIELFSPPSYNSLNVLEDHSDLEKCLEEAKNSSLPPSYSCVMLHQDIFHMSHTDLNKTKLLNMHKVSLSEADIGLHTADS